MEVVMAMETSGTRSDGWTAAMSTVDQAMTVAIRSDIHGVALAPAKWAGQSQRAKLAAFRSAEHRPARRGRRADIPRRSRGNGRMVPALSGHSS
jgi:hypothetical protein